MNEQPTSLAVSGSSLLITWTDGRQLRYDIERLRGCCPCASCREGRSQRGLADEEQVPVSPGTTIEQMAPVGNYGYKIRFSDGHDTGIYTLELLRSLGKESP